MNLSSEVLSEMTLEELCEYKRNILAIGRHGLTNFLVLCARVDREMRKRVPVIFTVTGKRTIGGTVYRAVAEDIIEYGEGGTPIDAIHDLKARIGLAY